MKEFKLEERESEGRVFYAARLLPCGLTAYGDTRDQAVARLKEMFSVWLDIKVKQCRQSSKG